jgi:hypothetical protein
MIVYKLILIRYYTSEFNSLKAHSPAWFCETVVPQYTSLIRWQLTTKERTDQAGAVRDLSERSDTIYGQPPIAEMYGQSTVTAQHQ